MSKIEDFDMTKHKDATKSQINRTAGGSLPKPSKSNGSSSGQGNSGWIQVTTEEILNDIAGEGLMKVPKQ